MKKTRVMFTSIIMCLLACNNGTQSNSIKAVDTDKLIVADTAKPMTIDNDNLIGTWRKSCVGSGHILISESLNKSVIEVNSNQIVIDAEIEILNSNQERAVLFRLNEPKDLGAGGMNLQWDDFSKDSIIAKLKLIDDSTASLIWYGFYDNKLKKRIWTTQFDLLLDESGEETTTNEVKVKKCNSL